MAYYKCPKCGGSDYYMSNRNVMKGIGGIWGNRGGVKKFPVCKVCEEIMDTYAEPVMAPSATSSTLISIVALVIILVILVVAVGANLF